MADRIEFIHCFQSKQDDYQNPTGSIDSKMPGSRDDPERECDISECVQGDDSVEEFAMGWAFGRFKHPRVG